MTADIDTAALRAEIDATGFLGFARIHGVAHTLCNAVDAARAERDEYLAHCHDVNGRNDELIDRAEAAEARLTEIRDEYEAWNTEGLGTCQLLYRTNYPDAWIGIGVALYGEMR